MIRLAAFLLPLTALAAPGVRIIIVKADGVPAGLLHQVLAERNPATGKSRLPWIDEIFGRQGARLENFYVRGISLSAPSWALLDTGRHQRIHGNVEYDRETLEAYDYLNFVPFYIGNAKRRSADMPGVEVLDASGIPLLIDRFPWAERYQSFQLYERWIRWKTLQRGLTSRFQGKSPRDLLDEWLTGLDFSSGIFEQTERELIERLRDPGCLYLDFYTGEFDHLAHLDNDREAQVAELQRLDARLGRIWTAIQTSPLASRTVLALVSDHGMNSTPGQYSQGYNLVDWFGSAEGGAHHSATDRYPLDEYKLKGLNPLVSEVITPSPEASYLKDQAQDYPTAYLDLDGNERAAVELRNSDLNALHILLRRMPKPGEPMRAAAIETFFDILDTRRPEWRRSLDDLSGELDALRRSILRRRADRKRPHSDAEGGEQEHTRRAAQLFRWEQTEHAENEYLQVMNRLLTLDRKTFDPARVRIEDVIPRRSLGEPNSFADLRNYVAGPSKEGLIPARAGPGLDPAESFRHIDYLAALEKIFVRNTQKGLGSRPIDFAAARVSAPGSEEAVLLYADESHQALVLCRQNAAGEWELRYLPVLDVRGEAGGAVAWSPGAWVAGLPLEVWEDPELRLPAGTSREQWLDAWHTSRDWLRAVHLTRYSNGVVGIAEQFIREPPLACEDPSAPPADAALLIRFEARRRRMVEPDFIILANDHWNFNVRNFNPGGNHGSFFRVSTHSILMFAGGSGLSIPRATVISEPYDSLSFAPTLLKLAGFDAAVMPGPVIQEILPKINPPEE